MKTTFDRKDEYERPMPFSLGSAAFAALWVGACFIVGLILAGALHAQNVLILQADDFGTDKVSSYGLPGAPSTPELDTLANGGLRFTSYWTNPIGASTRAAILSGQYGFRNRIGCEVGANGSQWGLDPRLPQLLPKSLPPQYVSIAIGKWGLGTPASGGEYHPILCGFDLYCGALGGFEAPESYFGFTKTATWWVGSVSWPCANYATLDEALDCIAALEFCRLAGLPFLIYCNFHAVAAPFHNPPGATETTVAGQSAAMARYLDTCVGMVLRAVDFSTTNVIFVGSNGSCPGTGSPALRGGRGEIYEGGISAPLIVAGPSTFGNVGVLADLVCAVDIYATVLDLVGARGFLAHDSVPFTALLSSFVPYRSWAFSEWFTPNGSTAPGSVAKAARDERFKLVLPTLEFFDLWLDPSEASPLNPQALTQVQAAHYSSLQTVLGNFGF